MMHAYDKVYLEKAQVCLGRVLDFAVRELEYDIEDFFGMFVSTGEAERFGSGDFSILVGKSGAEVVFEVLEKAGIKIRRFSPVYPQDRSEEYWTGWALAYYQWYTGLRFKEISSFISLTEIRAMYSPYHEMDIRHFADAMNRLYSTVYPDTNLKRKRRGMGLSQSQLAQISGIPVRTIQQYEQRQKNINKAQVEYLMMLSQALCCRIEDLVERV